MIGTILIWAVIVFAGLIFAGLFCSWIIDIYYKRKKQHILELVKILGEAAGKAVEAIEQKKKEK